MGPILYYIHHLSPVYEYKGMGMKGGLSSVQNCIWFMYGALLQQGMYFRLLTRSRSWVKMFVFRLSGTKIT